jgi:hypothetical protein
MTCRNSDKRCSDSDAEAFAKSHSCNGSEPGFQALLTECRVSGAEFGAASVCNGSAKKKCDRSEQHGPWVSKARVTGPIGVVRRPAMHVDALMVTVLQDRLDDSRGIVRMGAARSLRP